MNLAGLVEESIADGDGIRIAIFISGCKHKCKNCHNPKTWFFDYGEPFTSNDKNNIFNIMDKNIELMDGITLTGGDPFYSSKELIPFVQEFKNKFPDKNVWAFTGFLWEDLIANEDMFKLASLCDVIVDGPFKEEVKDFTQEFRGSTNQRIIDVQETITQHKIILHKGANI